MTLKEIEKLIDRSTIIFVDNSKSSFYVAKGVFTKEVLLHNQGKEMFENNGAAYFYERNKETGEMTLLAKVDHIDKEKKIIKKKLGDMTQEEIWRVKENVCSICHHACDGCPLLYKSTCLAFYFKHSEKLIEETKDKEFDVEVEE